MLPIAGAINTKNNGAVEGTFQYGTGRDRVTKELGPVWFIDYLIANSVIGFIPTLAGHQGKVLRQMRFSNIILASHM